MGNDQSGWGKIRRHYNSFGSLFRRAFIIGSLCCAWVPALAADDTSINTDPAPALQQTLTPDQQAKAAHRKALLALGHQFAQTIGSELQEADLYLAGADKVTLDEHRSKTAIPDNEPLIMRASAEDGKVAFPQDIYAIKRGNRLFISFADFCTSVNIAISVHPAKGTADGWFIHENQTFHLDAAKHEVNIMGKTESFDPKDVDISDPTYLMVSTTLIEKWFGLSFHYNFAALVLDMTTTQPLPAEEVYNRRQKNGVNNWTEAAAKLPRIEVPYQMASEPYIDVSTNNSISKVRGATATSINNWSAITNGDVAGFNLETFLSGNLPSVTGDTNPKENPYLTTARLTLGKTDPDGGLLGPLHATAYAMGDVNTANIPVIGNGSLEQGAQVTNQPTNITTQTSADVRGNAQPGWDIELYRNNVYQSIQHVDLTGLYDFQNVQLVLGDNDIKLLLYGEHGEVNEEHRHILVDPSLLVQRTGYYNVSVSRNNVNTFNPIPASAPSGPGTGDANVAADYQYGLGNIGTLDFGQRRHSDNGSERDFSEAGLASFVGNTYVNANIGINDATRAAASTLTARRNFGNQSGTLAYDWYSPSFNISSSTAKASVKDLSLASLSGPIPGKFHGLSNLNYSLNATDTNNYDSSSALSFSPTLSARLNNLSFSGSAAYNRNTSATGDVSTIETASLVAHGFVYGGNWRVTDTYNVKPSFQATETDVEYDHSLRDNLDSTSEIKYTNSPRVTLASESLNWRTSKATISPTISADTTNNLTVSVNVHFGTAADPYSHRYSMYNTYMSGVGGVAARVFYDKHGTGVYEPDDELMPDVSVKALQLHRTATTDTRGIAFIPDISTDTVTDIIAENGTFKDSYQLSLFEGVSIRTHPGSITQLDFPVVTGGELDGQADAVDSKGTHKSAANLKISLIAPDGKVEKTVNAASDGYYAISSIRPGVYYLNATTEDEDTTAGLFMTKMIVFKPEGTTLFGQNIALTPGYNTQYIYESENAAPSGPRHTRVIRPEDIESQKVQLRLGQYHSRLALTFSWYRFKIRSQWGGDFSLVKPLLDITTDSKTLVMSLDVQPNQPMSLPQAASVCQGMQDDKFPCAVKVITKYREPALSAALPGQSG